jgi:hypothetical protein
VRIGDAHEGEGHVAGRHLPRRPSGAADREAGIVRELDVVAELEAVDDVAAVTRLRHGNGAREIAEELGLAVSVGPIVHAWVYRITAAVDVLVVSYGCEAAAWPETLESPEGKDVALFALDEIDAVRLPDGYRCAIRRWAQIR